MQLIKVTHRNVKSPTKDSEDQPLACSVEEAGAERELRPGSNGCWKAHLCSPEALEAESFLLALSSLLSSFLSGRQVFSAADVPLQAPPG